MFAMRLLRRFSGLRLNFRVEQSVHWQIGTILILGLLCCTLGSHSMVCDTGLVHHRLVNGGLVRLGRRLCFLTCHFLLQLLILKQTLDL